MSQLFVTDLVLCSSLVSETSFSSKQMYQDAEEEQGNLFRWWGDRNGEQEWTGRGLWSKTNDSVYTLGGADPRDRKLHVRN